MLFEFINQHITSSNPHTVVIDSNLNSYSYADLYKKIKEIECLFQANNLKEGSIIILQFDKSFLGLAYLLTCLKLGIIYIPVDVNIPKNKLESVINSSNANALIDENYSIKKLNVIPSNVSKNSCCVLYTSGSTGHPKGVIISHENLKVFVGWSSQEFSITDKDIFTSYAPFHFDLSTFDIFTSLKQGAKIWLINKALSTNFKLISKQIEKVNPTIWYTTPTVYKLLNTYGKLIPDTSPRLALFAGEVFNINELNSLRKIWDKTIFYNLYGPTETNVCTYYKLPSNIETNRIEAYPIGKACDYAETTISENGELLVSGKSIMLGYINEILLAEDKFIILDGKKWLKTGDIVEERNGLIHYLHRNDRMVKHNGFRLELGEIEKELKKHINIIDVACIYTDNKIVAIYTGQKTSTIELKTFCSKHLLKYMIPNHFYHLTELPINSNGKIDYSELINNFNLNE